MCIQSEPKLPGKDRPSRYHADRLGTTGSTSKFTYRAVGRNGPGDFTAKQAGWQNRYPFRPMALTQSQADFISIHFYPKNEEEFKADLQSVEFAQLKFALERSNKTLLCTEFGVFKAAYPDAVEALKWAARLQHLILENGFKGCLFWQYDTEEQPGLWSAIEGDRAILQELTGR